MTGCPELPEDAWHTIIESFVDMHALRAAKMLRKYARISHVWWSRAREHPDF